jgi:hypothetical protein
MVAICRSPKRLIYISTLLEIYNLWTNLCPAFYQLRAKAKLKQREKNKNKALKRARW